MRKSTWPMKNTAPPNKKPPRHQERKENKIELLGLLELCSLLLNFLLRLPCSVLKQGILILLGLWKDTSVAGVTVHGWPLDAIFNTPPKPALGTAGLVAQSTDNSESGQYHFSVF